MRCLNAYSKSEWSNISSQGSAANGRQGKTFSGCRCADKYVRLYAPKNKLNNGKGIIFYVNPPKYSFRKKSMHCFWGDCFSNKTQCLSSLHWIISLLFCSVSYSGVCLDVFKHSVSDIKIRTYLLTLTSSRKTSKRHKCLKYGLLFVHIY